MPTITSPHALAPAWNPLAHIDEYLLARGWTNDGVGWLPPEALKEIVENFHGRGQFTRSFAISVQVRVDEWRYEWRYAYAE